MKGRIYTSLVRDAIGPTAETSNLLHPLVCQRSNRPCERIKFLKKLAHFGRAVVYVWFQWYILSSVETARVLHTASCFEPKRLSNA
jgi:uncharacterized membrane protein (DUF106 family)